jgi:hypothetical protein
MSNQRDPTNKKYGGLVKSHTFGGFMSSYKMSSSKSRSLRAVHGDVQTTRNVRIVTERSTFDAIRRNLLGLIKRPSLGLSGATAMPEWRRNSGIEFFSPRNSRRTDAMDNDRPFVCLPLNPEIVHLRGQCLPEQASDTCCCYCALQARHPQTVGRK